MATNITLRTQLLGGVTEFCANSEVTVFRDTITLVELIVLLARYQEEGVQLRPEVYVLNDLSSFMSRLPDGEHVHLGQVPSNLDGLKRAVKKAAPLSKSPWCIYIEVGAEINYGLFRGASTALAVPTDDIVLSDDPDLRVVKASCVASECVEVRSNRGRLHRIFLDHRADDAPPPLRYIDDLVALIVSDVPASSRDGVSSLLKNVIAKSLRESHGALVAVTSMKRAPKFLAADGSILNEPIDFHGMIDLLKAKKMEYSVVESRRALVEGMFQSDGIILFDTRAKLLGFNCFIQSSSKNLVGGARRRAFSALKDKIGSGLSGAFIQSQDGWTDFSKDA